MDKYQKELIDMVWDDLCLEIFQYHDKKITNYNNEEEKLQYLHNLSELELKIYCICKVGGKVSLELALHKDFPKVMNKFKIINKGGNDKDANF